MDIESNALLRAIIGASSSAFVSIDSAQNIQLFSEGAEAMFGYTAKEVSGRPVAMLLPKQFRKSHKKHVTSFVRGSEESRLMHDRNELIGLRKDGSEFAAEASIIRFEEDGETKSAAILHDVTERKATDAALQKSEDQFRQVFEDGPLGIALVGLDNTLLAVNDRYCQITGFSEEELLGRRFTEITHPDDIEWNLELAGKGAAGQINSYKTEKRYIRKDGATVWASITANMLRDAAGKPLYRITMVEDITAQKLAADALKASEERFRQIFERGPLGMSLVTPEGVILSSNERLSEMLGYSRSELKGRRFTDVTHPDDVQMNLDLNERLFKGEIPSYGLEKRYISKKGDIVWGNLTASAMHGPDGRPENALAMIEDITERKKEQDRLRESEERFRQTFERGPLGMSLVTIDGVILSANERLSEMLGYSQGELEGRRFADLTHPDDVQTNLDIHERLLKGEIPSYQLEKRYISKKGDVVWGNLTVSAMHGPDGKPQSSLAMIEDITERKKEQDKLVESEERFRQTFERGPLGMALVTLDGVILSGNERLSEILGYSREELDGRRFNEVTHPDDVQMNVDLNARLFNGEIPSYRLEKRYISKKGDVVWGNVTVSAMIGPDGKPVNALAMVEDITERKKEQDKLSESEERFRRVFQDAPIGMAMAGPNKRFLAVSNRLCKMLGYSEEELKKLTFNDITHPEDIEMGMARLAEVGQSDTPHFDLEKRYITKSGETVWARLTLSAIKNPRGEVQYNIAMVEDITEKRLAVEALRQSEERFRKIFRDAPIGMAMINLDGRFLAVSKRFCKMLGYSEEELKERTFQEITHPDDLMVGQEMLTAAIRGEIPYFDVEKRYVTKSGATLWARLTLSVIKNPEGEVQYNIAMVEDITEKKQAADALQESEARFRQTFDLGPLGMAMVGLENEFIALNDRYCEITGYSKDELMKKSFAEITHPDDVGWNLALAKKNMEMGIDEFNIEKRYIRKDGEVVWVSITSSMVKDAHGHPVHTIAMVEDITEKKHAADALQESEERFRRIFQDAPMGMAMASTDNRFLAVNDQFCKMLGYSEEELTRLTFSDITHPDDVEKSLKVLREASESGSPHYEIEKRYITKAGETVWAHLTSSIIRNPEGEVQFNIGMVEDITEKRLAAEALRKSEEELRRAQKMEAVGQLTGGVAHEFNNLLMVVLGNIELLDEGLPKDDPMRKFAKTAMKSVQRGSELTQSLLAFSRKQSLKTDNVDVNGLVHGMRSLLQRSLGETILIETDLDESLWPVAADANQIEGALLNFLLNSRDAMPRGGTIIVRTQNRGIANPGLRGAEGNAPESDFVVLEVEDFGVGMSDEVIERAFEPFFTTKEVGKGTGLGLSVIYGFAKQSGGFLEIDSTPGQGTTIRLYLPRAVGPKDKAKGKKPKKQSKAKKRKKQGKAKRAKKVKNKGRPKTTGK